MPPLLFPCYPTSVARLAAVALIFLALTMASGCASLMTSAASGLAENLSGAILNQDDPKTVEDGAPSYLLLSDGLIESDPDNVRLLMSGANLYSAYAAVFVRDEERAKRLTRKARDYGKRAMCRRHPVVCAAGEQSFDTFAATLDSLDKNDVPVLYVYATTWAGWIQAHRSDWGAVADLAKVEACMRRVVALDEGYEQGGAHVYLAILATLLPQSLGGRPEEGRQHFERAIELSQGRDLMVKVHYAERYARLVFDRPLHDRLLREVLGAETQSPGLTLLNTLAKERAQQLLDSGNAYF